MKQLVDDAASERLNCRPLGQVEVGELRAEALEFAVNDLVATGTELRNERRHLREPR